MKAFFAATALLALSCLLSAQDTGTRPAGFTGNWRSTPFDTAMATELQTSIYGPGAHSRRTVTLAVRPSGAGTFTVTNSVIDRRGRIVAGTREVQHLEFEIGDLVAEPGRRPYYRTRVVRAERRFPEPPASTFSLDGASLDLYEPESKGGAIEVRFETADGRGSFWETMRRAPAAPGAAVGATSSSPS